MRWSGATKPITARRLRVTSCPICRDPLTEGVDDDNCPTCHQPSRTRSLGPVMEEVVWPAIDKRLAAGTQMLAFATTPSERQLIDHGIGVKAVSLYGHYSAENQVGVDVPALEECGSASFSGAYSILLFDYFLEHEQALAELARVIAPGGMLFTHIGPHRVEDGSEAPRAENRIEDRAGYFEYLPDSHEMLDIRVGRDWLLQAMSSNGFEPTDVQVEDSATGTVNEGFVGHRERADGAVGVGGSPALRRLSRAATSLPLRLRRSRHQPGAGSNPPRARTAARRRKDEAVYSVPVDPAFGFSRVVVRLTIPSGA